MPDDISPRTRSSSRLVFPGYVGVLAVLAIVLATLVLWRGLLDDQARREQQERDVAARHLADRVALGLGARTADLDRMAQHWEIYGNLPQHVWERDAVAYLRDLPDAPSLAWIDSAGRARWTVPRSGSAPGAVLHDASVARDLREAARRNPQSMVSDLVTLASGERVLYAVRALTVNGRARGHLVGAFRIDALFDQLLAFERPSGATLVITRDGLVVYGPGTGAAPEATATSVVPLALGSPGWALRLSTPSGTSTAAGSALPWAVLGSGLAAALFIGIVAALWRLSLRRTRQATERGEALRESEQRLHLALEGSGQALWDWNIASGKVYLSEQWAQLIGDPPGPTLTTLEALAALVHPDERATQMERIRAALKGEVPAYRAEHRVRTRDGGWKWIQSHGQVVERDASGRARRMIGTNADISERKRTEESLVLQGRAMEAGSVGIAIADARAPDTPLIYVNPAFERITGYPRDQAIGRNCRFLQRDDRDQPGVADIRQALRDGREVTALLRNYRQDGALFWNQFVLAPVRDAAGQLTHFIGITQDVSRRVEAEARLRETTRLLDSVVENIPNMIFMKRASDLRFVLFNRAGEELLGYSRHDLIGRNDYDFFPREQAEFFVNKDRRVLERLDFEDIPEEPIQTRGQGVRILHTKKIALRDEQGQAQFLLGISEDITDQKRSELSLRESERLLREAQRIAKVGNWSLEVATGRVEWSDEIYRIFACNPEDFQPTYERFLAMVHPDDVARVRSEEQRAYRSGERHGIDHRIILPNGEIRWVREEGVAEYGAEGHPVRLIGIVQDITERKRVEEHLRRQHELLAAISRAQTRFISETDVRPVFDGLLADILAITASEYGFIGELDTGPDGTPRLMTPAVAAATGSGAADRVYVERAPGGLAFDRLDFLSGAALASGRPVIANDPCGHPPLTAFLCAPFHLGGRPVGMVGLANRPGGYDAQLVEFLQPLLSTIAHLVGAMRSEHRRGEAERTVRETAQRMRAIVETVIDGIITIDERGVIESFNPSAERIFGYRADEVVGHNVTMLMSEPYAGEHDRYIQHYLATGEGRIIGAGRELEGRRKDGTPVPLEVSLSEMWLGTRRRFTGVVRDITERKKVERLKNEFVSTVSHELRTPLTSIRGSLGLVAGGVAGTLPDKASELIGIAYKNSERLTNLINDILDVERIESGRMKFSVARQPLMPLIEQAIEANRGYAQGLNVGLRLVQGCPDAVVRVDGDRLLQVMANLLSNAAKFSPPGSEVDVTVAPHGRFARIAVRDRGPGVPDEFRGRIFEKFSQADASDTRVRGGSGLGLSISRAIVERMGGTIGFESTAGEGTRFHVDLPVSLPEHLAGGPVPTDPGRPRVLICEDDADVAAMIALILAGDGYVADTAHDAAEAKVLLAGRDYAAMTLDLGLPDQNGIALIRELRTQPSTRDLPIVVVSGHAEDGQTQLRGGFAVLDWLTKPIDEQRLLAAVAAATRAVGGYRARVLHVEDDPDVCSIVASIGAAVADFDQAATLAEARVRLARERYQLVILDLALPDGSGLELLPVIKGLAAPPPVLLFSAHDVGGPEAAQVDAVLVKSQTSNAELVAMLRMLVRDAEIRLETAT